MILGVMQPYFFPYFGYFDHISRCDKWVVFDIAQYTPKTWMNRNRILHPAEGWQYVRVDLKKTHRNDLISSVHLVSLTDSMERLTKQLAHYKKKAPFYPAVIELVRHGMLNAATDRLVDVNISSISAVCEYLGIPFKPIVASAQAYDLPPISHPGQWALEISRLEGADTYINPPGGRNLFRPEEFRNAHIRLGFVPSPNFVYPTPGYHFEEKLSIIDVLMWNSPESVRSQLGRLEVDYVE